MSRSGGDWSTVLRVQEVAADVSVMKDPKPEKLSQLSLIREVYRLLLDRGRTYAAFEEESVFPLVQALSHRQEILDPMSGYGSLMLYCSKLGTKAYCLEVSLPLYLWQVLVHPDNAAVLMTCVQRLESLRNKWPRTSVRALVSDDWFPPESRNMIVGLLHLNRSVVQNLGLSSRKVELMSLALIMPFVGRLSCSVQGNVTTHVKKGGICVYLDWQDDYSACLEAIHARLAQNMRVCKAQKHTIRLGDCRTTRFPERGFRAMITSPPYPNHRDFSSIFAPENDCLSWLYEEGLISHRPPSRLAIGTNVVSGRSGPVVKSDPALRFLKCLEEFSNKKRPKAEYDNKVYYIPYFSHYFADLERAYGNVASYLSRDFDGYVIAVNNTSRDQVIPVSETIMEIWQALGFSAKIVDAQESFHIGTKNPRARGFKAKHTEYTIRIRRK